MFSVQVNNKMTALTLGLKLLSVPSLKLLVQHQYDPSRSLHLTRYTQYTNDLTLQAAVFGSLPQSSSQTGYILLCKMIAACWKLELLEQRPCLSYT